jgi:carboxylate-amine ligase
LPGIREPSFTYGIEEEYLLTDPVTLNLASEPPEAIFNDAKAAAKSLPGSVSRELIRAQLEIGTGVCRTPKDAATQLKGLRQIAVDAAEQNGHALFAASSHPFSKAKEQRQTNRRRYREIADDLQFVARRLMVCGMHVHVGIEDVEMRILILNGLREYLPLLLALSASSPFWEGENTGLKSVRPVILDQLPRGGLPDRFANYSAYARALKSLTGSGVIEDASKIWWDARLSAKWPTVEIRLMDVTPLVEDALALAALCRCLCRMLWRRAKGGFVPDLAPRLVVMENRWRAQRDGINATLIDHRTHNLIPIPDRARELWEGLREDAEFFGCRTELRRIAEIAAAGTSADRQLSLLNAEHCQKRTVEEKLQSIVLQVAAETKRLHSQSDTVGSVRI